MSTEFQDVGAATSPPPPSGDSPDTASSAGQESSPDTSASTVGGVTATQSEQDNSGNVIEQAGSAAPTQDIDPLEGVPSLEELSQNQSQPYAKALVQLRTAYDALKPKVSELEPLSAFKDLVSQTTPEQLTQKLEIIDGFFAPALDENQQPILDPVTNLPLTTALPGLQKLATESPDTVYTIINDALSLQIDGVSLEEQVTNYLLQKRGLNPANIQQYAEWEKTGAPVATSGVDLSVIPEQYRAAFQKLPATIQNDLVSLMASERPEDKEIAQYHLDKEKRDFDNQQQRATEQQQRQQAFQAGVDKAGTEFVETIFKEEYDSTLKSIASQWQSSSDPNRDALQHHMIMNTLVNLTDPRMSFSAEQWLKSLNVQPDPLIPQLAQSVENKAKQVKAAEAYGDKFKAGQLQEELRNERLQLKAKVNGVATLMVQALSGQLVLNQGQTDALLGGAETRPSVVGTGATTSGRRPLVNPNDLTDRRNFIDIARNTGLLSEG